MKIRHERPQSDLAFQVRAPLSLELSTGECLTIEEWSLRGFQYPEDKDLLPKEAVLSIPFQGVVIRFPVRLAREGDTRFLAFEGLTGRQRETLGLFYRAILSGKMAATDEIITSLDTPVDLVPMEETETEKQVGAAGKAPRELRAAMSLATYLLLGCLAFWTLGSGIWSKLATVTVQNARVEADLIDHTAAARGYVAAVHAIPGDHVARGDLLVRLSDPEGDAALADVRARIDLIENRLARATLAQQDIETRLIQARQEIFAAMVWGDPTAPERLAAFDARRLAEHQDLFAAFAAATQQTDTLADELRRLKRERGRLRDAGDAMNVLAQADGIVRDLSVLKGQLVGRGTPVAVLETTAPRTVRGWLPHQMASAVHTGMDVTIRSAEATGPRVLQGQVIGLEAAIDPELSPEFGMLVTIGFTDLTADDTRKLLTHRAPVTLAARRAWASAWDRRIDAWLAPLGL